jgi:hypothetical protein
MSFQYTKHVWNEVEGITGLKNAWNGNLIEEALRYWCNKRKLKGIKSSL